MTFGITHNSTFDFFVKTSDTNHHPQKPLFLIAKEKYITYV